MSTTQAAERERALLAALAVMAERLLHGADPSAVPEVLGVLGSAAGLSRLALVAARFAGSGSAPRLEGRQQWAAPGVARLVPGADGWPRYPARWQAALEQGQTISGPTRAFAAEERAVLEAAGVRSALFVPVLADDDWYGHLCCHDTESERSWTQPELDAVHAAAAMLGAAMHQRRVLAVVERRTALLRAVGVATSLLLEASSWRHALPRVLDGIRTVTRARSAWAYGPDPALPRSRAVLLYEVLAPGLRPGGARPRRLDLSTEAAAGLQTAGALHAGMGDDEIGPLRQALATRATSWAAVPMILEPGSVGLVGLEADGARSWAEGELEALGILASALKAAIQRGSSGVAVPVVPNAWGSPPARAGRASPDERITVDAVLGAERGRDTEDAGNLR